jgi:amidase
LSGVAVEQRANVTTLRVNIIKGWSFARPGLKTEKFPHEDWQRRSLEGALGIAHREPEVRDER